MNIEYNCFESKTPGAYNFHLHDYCELYLLLEGDLNFYVHRSCYHITAGSLLIINDLEMHKAINLSEHTHKRIYIHIPRSFFEGYSTDNTKLETCFHDRELGKNNLLFLTKEQTTYFINQYNAMKEVSKSDCFGKEVLVDTYLIQLLLMINDNYIGNSFSNALITQYPKNIHKIVSYIDEHILDKLTLEQIAKHLSMDKYYICHAFKRETGTTIFQYIHVKRIALAKILLTEGKSVTEACYQSGFRDYTNFITSFKKVTGYTPKKYQESKKI